MIRTEKIISCSVRRRFINNSHKTFHIPTLKTEVKNMSVVKTEPMIVGDNDGCLDSLKNENNIFVNEEMSQLISVKEDCDYQSSLNIDNDIKNSDQKPYNNFNVCSKEENITEVMTDDNDVFYDLEMFLRSVKEELPDINTDVAIEESKVQSDDKFANLSLDKYKLKIEYNDEVIKIEKEELDGYVFESEISIEKNKFSQILNGENYNTINDSKLGILSESYCNTEIDQKKNKFEKNIFICDLCHQKFNSKKILILHIKHHLHDLKKCSSDVFSRSTEKYIKVEPKQTYLGTKLKFMCTYCSKSFSDQSNYNRHAKYHCPRLILSDMDSSVKRFKCSTCLLTFKSKYNLQVHQKLHTGEKPFKCDICSLAFHRKDYMHLHRKIHKNEYSEDHFCKICHEKFNTKQSLLRHKKSHVVSYYCNYCERPYTRKDSLIYHLRSKHTGERPYKCKICQTSFFDNSVLLKHNKSKSHKLNVATRKLKIK